MDHIVFIRMTQNQSAKKFIVLLGLCKSAWVNPEKLIFFYFNSEQSKKHMLQDDPYPKMNPTKPKTSTEFAIQTP